MILKPDKETSIYYVQAPIRLIVVKNDRFDVLFHLERGAGLQRLSKVAEVEFCSTGMLRLKGSANICIRKTSFELIDRLAY